MEKTCEYDVCTGCMVCASVCPKECISFRAGDFGHVYPHIDTTQCIDCNRCRKVCPAIIEVDFKQPTKAYAAMINDRGDYATTTSGGAATALAQNTIEKGGVVYGCASLPGAVVEHIRVDNATDINKLKGSKYVQSDTGKILKQLQLDVKGGTETLFIGTPCQTAAVKAIFPRKPENLTTIDLICHGVPSVHYLQEYLASKGLDLSSLGSLGFRGIRGYQIVAKQQFGSRKIVYESTPLSEAPYSDAYYAPFYWGFSYRPSCFKCRYARPERASDITIGDFWGLGKMGDTSNIPAHPNGISVILPNTDKGEILVKELKYLMTIVDRPVEEAIQGNEQLRHPHFYTSRNRIFDLLRPIIGVMPAFRVAMIDKITRRIAKKILKPQSK